MSGDSGAVEAGATAEGVSHMRVGRNRGEGRYVENGVGNGEGCGGGYARAGTGTHAAPEVGGYAKWGDVISRANGVREAD